MELRNGCLFVISIGSFQEEDDNVDSASCSLETSL